MRVPAPHPERGPEILRGSEAERGRDSREFRGVIRQDVGLLLLADLEPVLDPPEKPVGLPQAGGAGGVHEPVARQEAERLLRRICLQERVPPRVQQLERLRHELDLADAARPELHVAVERARPDDLGVASGLHRGDLLKEARGGMPRVPEPMEALEQLGAQLEAARHGPRLDHRQPLPGLARRPVVVLELGRGAHEGTDRPLGPQAHVRPKEEPVLGALIERAGDRLGDLREELLVGDRRLGAAPLARSVALVEVDEVDVRGEVELAPAELSEGHDAEAGPLSASPLHGNAEALLPSADRLEGAFPQAELGEERQLLHGRPLVGEVVDAPVGDPHRHEPPPPAQQPEAAGVIQLAGAGREFPPGVQERPEPKGLQQVSRLLQPWRDPGIAPQLMRVQRARCRQALDP